MTREFIPGTLHIWFPDLTNVLLHYLLSCHCQIEVIYTVCSSSLGVPHADRGAAAVDVAAGADDPHAAAAVHLHGHRADGVGGVGDAERVIIVQVLSGQDEHFRRGS